MDKWVPLMSVSRVVKLGLSTLHSCSRTAYIDESPAYGRHFYSSVRYDEHTGTSKVVYNSPYNAGRYGAGGPGTSHPYICTTVTTGPFGFILWKFDLTHIDELLKKEMQSYTFLQQSIFMGSSSSK